MHEWPVEHLAMPRLPHRVALVTRRGPAGPAGTSATAALVVLVLMAMVLSEFIVVRVITRALMAIGRRGRKRER